MEQEPAYEPSALEAFRARYWTDLDSGCSRSIREYLDLFPGDDEAVVREYVVFRRAREVSSAGGTSSMGPYRIEEEIGRGGQGVVYRATDTRIGRTVALKVLRGLGPGGEELLRRFEREAIVASRLDDPGICAVYEAGDEQGVPYIAMRFVEGSSLAQRISSRWKTDHENTWVTRTDSASPTIGASLPAPSERVAPASGEELRELVGTFASLARSLHAAHEAGVVHRDIKPANIMITTEARPVILDFGLARGADQDLESLTRSGDFFGTPAYMSPEQLTARRVRVDRRTDIWSLGVTLYEALTGRRPFAAATREGIYQAILSKDPPHPRRLHRAIGKDLSVVVLACLEKDRDRRYLSALDLANDLEAVLDGRPIAVRPVGSVGRLLRWSRREPAKAALVAALLVALPVLAAILTAYMKDRPAVEAARLASLGEEVDRLLAEGFSELTDGAPDRAIALFEEAFAIDGDAPEAAAGMALAHLAAARPGATLETLDRHAALLAGRRAATSLRVSALAQLGRRAESQALQATIPAPRNALDFYLLGVELLARGDAGDSKGYPEALAAVEKAILLAPGPRALYFVAAAKAAGSCDDPSGPALALALTTHWDDSPVSWFYAGFLTADIDARIAAYRRALALREDYPSAWNNLGNALMHKGDLDEALEAYRSAIRLDPDYAKPWYGSGNVLLATQDLEGASAAYRRATEIDPRYAKAWYQLGLALDFAGRMDGSVAALREAVRLQPDNVRFLNQLGIEFQRRGDYDRAIEMHRKVLDLDPRSARAWNNLGTVLRSRGDRGPATEAFRKATELDPGHAKAWKNLGADLLAGGERGPAIQALSKATELDPGYGDAWSSLGQALSEEGRLDDALHAYRKALEAEPADADAWFNIANLHATAGRHDEAIDAYLQAIARDPGHRDGWFNLGNSLKGVGALDRAIEAHCKAVAVDPEYAVGWCNLGHTLREVGSIREALVAFERGHALGATQAGWKYRSDAWVRSCREELARLADGEARVEALLREEVDPDAVELPDVARAARMTGRAVTAAAWYRSATAAAPELLAGLGSRGVLEGLAAAIAAGMGRGPEAEELGEEARSEWRALGRKWLADALRAWTRSVDSQDVPKGRVARVLDVFRNEPALSAVREPRALEILPEAERVAWREVWTKLEELRARLPE